MARPTDGATAGPSSLLQQIEDQERRDAEAARLEREQGRGRLARADAVFAYRDAALQARQDLEVARAAGEKPDVAGAARRLTSPLVEACRLLGDRLNWADAPDAAASLASLHDHPVSSAPWSNLRLLYAAGLHLIRSCRAGGPLEAEFAAVLERPSMERLPVKIHDLLDWTLYGFPARPRHADESGAETPGVEAPPPQRSQAAGKKRGRKVKESRPDRHVYEAWQTGAYASYKDLAKEVNRPAKDVRTIIDRYRKREARKQAERPPDE
jgi:hypothetical protein